MNDSVYCVVFSIVTDSDLVLFARGWQGLLDVLRNQMYLEGDTSADEEGWKYIVDDLADPSSWERPSDDRTPTSYYGDFDIGSVTIYHSPSGLPAPTPGPNTRQILEQLGSYSLGRDERLSITIGDDDCIGFDVINAALAENGLSV